ncbi:hypothetical protein [Dictyobacter kobayashii]|uniref:Uncharacterized protein n=1 Tax=Dictyobacter kobayashii TaxID=2014872 RepID=A0A402AQ66_9CHLR|nr:hypothetical protein [Dictyobacter kobayashii]GCE21303.1 hypothetical protein KDK_51030 [Dictyobacter kobayashii]
MDQQTYIINFDNVSGAEANIYASELRDVLLDTSSDIEVERRRDNPHTQDFGATLVLILGTPAILATAKAVGTGSPFIGKPALLSRQPTVKSLPQTSPVKMR